MAITHLERGIFLSLFNRGGYVLDFSTNDFDNFTLMSVGLALCDHYRDSKGKSLTAYLNKCTDVEALKLLNDLMDYYEFITRTSSLSLRKARVALMASIDTPRSMPDTISRRAPSLIGKMWGTIHSRALRNT